MTPKLITKAQNHMNTTFYLTVSCEPHRQLAAGEVLEESHRLLAQLENELTEFREVSPVYQLNNSQTGQPIEFTANGFELLGIAMNMKNQTKGYFDCLAKSEGPERGIEIDIDKEIVWRLNDKTHLGFGAIGKGFALDKVRERIEQAGFQNYCLNGGGSSLLFSGFEAPEVPWQWQWSVGNNEAFSFSHLSGAPVAVGVSGTQERGLHLLDAEGQPIDSIHSSLVALPNAATADAYSTAMFVSNWEKAQTLFEEQETLPALAIAEKDNNYRWNGVFQQLWGAVCTLMVMFCVPLFGDEEIDLGDISLDDFSPYMYERNLVWIILPIFVLLAILLHLKKYRIDVSNPEPNGDNDESKDSSSHPISMSKDR